MGSVLDHPGTRHPDVHEITPAAALLAGEVTYVVAAAVLVPVCSWAASATYPAGSAAMVGGISLVVGVVYAVIGAAIAVPVLARLASRRRAAPRAARSAGANAAVHAGLAALVSLPLPPVGLVVQSVQNRGMDLPPDFFVVGVFGAPAVVGAALAPTVARWAAADMARARRAALVVGAGAALALALALVVALGA